jgi:hypothetical protein
MLQTTKTTDISSVLVGDLIYEESGKIVGTRVLGVDSPKIEYSYTAQGVLKGEIKITNTGTYYIILRSTAGVMYGEGKGVFMTTDGELATWTAQGIGLRHTRGDGKMTAIGSVFFRASSATGKLAFLNDIVAVFKYEEDQAGNVYGKK